LTSSPATQPLLPKLNQNIHNASDLSWWLIPVQIAFRNPAISVRKRVVTNIWAFVQDSVLSKFLRHQDFVLGKFM
jgi:hypothetical protein